MGGRKKKTETLAMNTEMMVFKKLYGETKMVEKVKMYLDMYEAEKGFSEETPLSKVTESQTHISYYKGVVAMIELIKLIGEEKVNEALRSFLAKHKFPKSQPIATDLVGEFLKVADKEDHPRIKNLFLSV